MHNYFYFLIALLALSSCQNKSSMTHSDLMTAYENSISEIDKLSYTIQAIDTFQDGEVWNNKGFALLEKRESDSILGFSFYGKRHDFPKDYIYDKGTGFEISAEDNQYKIREGGLGFLGSPGGQMVLTNLFAPEKSFDSVSLEETDDAYIATYLYPDNEAYNVTNIKKVIHYSKDNFLPTKVYRNSSSLGENMTSVRLLSDLKLNSEVPFTISEKKKILESLSVFVPEKPKPNPMLNGEMPSVILTNLMKDNQTLNLASNTPTLLDFWEIWCGPCIASMPKVDALHNTYKDQLRVIGITLEDPENGKELIEKKNISFTNAIGTQALKEQFKINSWPRYFLINKDGIIIKEYHGYSEAIEQDIKDII